MFQRTSGNVCLALLSAVVAAALRASAGATEMKCLDDVAATRGYSLGFPVNAQPTADGKTVLYLRSGPRDTLQRLYAFDIASGREREVIAPDRLLSGKSEKLSAEEKARRERARVSVSGFTKFALTRDSSRVLLALGGKLYVVSLQGDRIDTLPGLDWLAPEFSPDGTKVAALRNGDIHVIDIATGRDTQITHGAGATLTNGEAEFVAQEEMERRDGFWWSPDSRFIAYEQADLSPVEPHYIADPLAPEEKPVEFRYPRAGTANALVKLGVIAVTGGPTHWVPWNNNAWPYLVRVEWQKGGPLALLVENRLQTEEHYLAADPVTGATRLLWVERDAAWLSTSPAEPKEVPYWLPDGGGFLWMTERNGQSQLELHDSAGKLVNAVTPADFRFEQLLDVDETNGTAIVMGGTDRLSKQIYSISLHGGAPIPVAAARGWNSGEFGEQHALFAHAFDLLDGSRGVDLLSRDGRKIATLPSAAEKPHFLPEPSYFEVGTEKFDALVLRPRNFDTGRKYPVLLAVYGGPAAKMVWAALRQYFANQCLADMGYIVATSDNRGTPGRDAAWIRAVKGNAIDIPLADQVAALKGLGQLVPQMDLRRVGVFGWSFGGYFAAMATIRRPDIFAAGVAGAPVVDWQDYDTYYTERYMGLPQDNTAGYRASNVLTYAANLERPLLIVHGVTDDNVYFQNTMKLTLALLATGRPYDLMLLPGTHMLSDNLLRARETEAQLHFFAAHLGSGDATSAAPL